MSIKQNEITQNANKFNVHVYCVIFSTYSKYFVMLIDTFKLCLFYNEFLIPKLFIREHRHTFYF